MLANYVDLQPYSQCLSSYCPLEHAKKDPPGEGPLIQEGSKMRDTGNKVGRSASLHNVRCPIMASLSIGNS